MSNKNTSTQNTAVNTTADNAILVEGKLTAEQLNEVANKTDDVVAEVLKEGKLQGIKKSLSKRDWINIVGAGAIAAAGSAADMLVTNQLNASVNGEDAKQYSVLDIVGVSAATAVIATGVRAGLDFIPAVNANQVAGSVATSLVGNSAYVIASYSRDTLLNLVKGKLSVDVEALAE